MVARHIGMQVLPHAINLVAGRAVGWQKMQANSTAETSQRRLGNLAVMNAVVIQYHMDYRRVGVASQQFIQQRDEQGASLACAFNPQHLSGINVQAASQIPLHVLPRSKSFFLLPAAHPVEADFRIEMNIDLVFIDGPVPAWQRGQQLTDLVQTPCFGGFRPGTAHGRTRPAAACLHQRQGPAHGRHMNAHSRSPRHGFYQQFSGPRWPTPAVLAWAAPNQTLQKLQEPLAQFRLPVVFASIIQAPFPVLAKAVGHSVDSGIVNAQHMGGPVSRPTVEQVQNNQVANLKAGITALPQALAEPLLDEETDAGDNALHGNSLLGACSPEIVQTVWEFPFSFEKPPYSRVAAESRTVI